MGRKRQSGNTIKTPPGVELRHWKSGKVTLRISFYYRNVQCRETIKLEATASNIKYAHRLRCEIINAIERGTFSYADYFPNSKFAKRFGNVADVATNAFKEFVSEVKANTFPDSETYGPTTYQSCP